MEANICFCELKLNITWYFNTGEMHMSMKTSFVVIQYVFLANASQQTTHQPKFDEKGHEI